MVGRQPEAESELAAAEAAREKKESELAAVEVARREKESELAAAKRKREENEAREQELRAAAQRIKAARVQLEADRKSFAALVAGEVRRKSVKRMKRALGRTQRVLARDYFRSLTEFGAKYVRSTLEATGSIGGNRRVRSEARLDRARNRLAIEWQQWWKHGHTQGTEIEVAGFDHYQSM